MKIFNSHSFGKQQQGAALMEFAIALPVFLLLIVGVIEISNFVYAGQKSQSAAENIVNIINLQNDVSTPQLERMASMLPRIVRPFDITDNEYRVIVTSMQRDIDDPANDFAYIRWQKIFGGAGGDSRFAYVDGGSKQINQVTPEDLGGFTFVPGDQVVVVETYVFYKPILDLDLMQRLLGLRNSYLYHSTPPARPRTGNFQFHPDDLI